MTFAGEPGLLPQAHKREKRAWRTSASAVVWLGLRGDCGFYNCEPVVQASEQARFLLGPD